MTQDNPVKADCEKGSSETTNPRRNEMRELTSHKVNGLNEALTIEVLDEPGAGNACHSYRKQPASPELEKLLKAFPSGSSKIDAHLPTYGEAKNAIRAHVNGLRARIKELDDNCGKLAGSAKAYLNAEEGLEQLRQLLTAERQKCADLQTALDMLTRK